MAGSEVVRTARAIILVLQMRQNAHVTKGMSASRQKGVLNHLHADRAQQIPVHRLLPCRTQQLPALLLLLLLLPSISRLGLDRRNQSPG